MLHTNSNSASKPITAVRFPFADDDSPLIALPPPTSLRASKCHQRSRTAVDLPPLFNRTPSASPTRSSTFLPFLRPTRDRSISPERVSVKEAAEYEVTTPPDEGSLRLKSGKVEKLASWFDGASEPVKLSLCPSPSKEKLNPVSESDKMESIFSASNESLDNLTKRPQKRPTRPGHQASQSVGRFSFFRKTSQAQIKPDPRAADDLAQLDIHTSLFPSGVIDEFSPAAFKNLAQNAEGTAHRLQNGYRENLRALKQVSSEKNIQADELEASQTRNEHLKLQLTDMAETAAAQERTIARLREELDAARSIRMISPSEQIYSSVPSKPSHRRNRVSDVSTLNESESGSELSSAASIFSHRDNISHGMSSPGTSVAASPVLKSAIMFRPPHPPSVDVSSYEPIQVLECQRCHGVKPSEAWDVVTMMKAENSALKGRIEELESAQGDALAFLMGVGVAQ